MKTVPVRILVVDDFDAWRAFVVEHLRQCPNMRIIGAASDGSDAVRKAEDLQPDLILLDVSLPKLNGIEAARQIRELVPKAKILFVSSNSDPDVIRDVFFAGGQGYILKLDATSALLPGIEAVLLGRQFLSNSVKQVDGLGLGR